MNLVKRFFFSLIIVLSIFLLWFPYSIQAQTASPHFSLSPTVKETEIGSNFNVTVSIDTAENPVNGADAIIEYDQNLLEVVTVTEETFFPTTTSVTTTAGKIEIYGIADTNVPRSGIGTLATITFQGKSAGTAVVNFTCQSGVTNDSNINDTNNTDIIICSNNISGSYIVAGTDTSASITPIITSAVNTENVPQTAFFEPTLLILGGGTLLLFLGIAMLF